MRRLFLVALIGVSATLLISQGVAVMSYVVSTEQNRVLTAYERDAFVLGGRVQRILENPDQTDSTLAPLVNKYAVAGKTQVVVVDRSGVVVLTSNPGELPLGANFTSRPEISSALSGSVATGERWSKTLQSNLVYVAVPVISGSSVYGAVRLSFPHGEIDQAVIAHTSFLWWIAAAGVVLAVILSFIVSGMVIRPLRRIEQQTHSLSAGDFSARLPEGKGPAEIRSLAAAFNAMAVTLDSLLRQQRSFASDASHQLRTPLTALLLRIERARETLNSKPATAKQELIDAEAEVARLSSIVEGLLAIARSESGGLEKEILDLAQTAQDRVEAWRALAEERGITLGYDGPETLPCRTISTAPEQVIDNYIDNALSHSPRNSAVLVRVAKRGFHAVVEVIDSGEGMTPEQCERAFDRFWRADSTTDGSGLGLAIVKHLVELGGGSVALIPRGESFPGLIASATFPLP